MSSNIQLWKDVMLIDFLASYIFCSRVFGLDGAYDHIYFLGRMKMEEYQFDLHIVVNNNLNSFLIRVNNYRANEQQRQ